MKKSVFVFVNDNLDIKTGNKFMEKKKDKYSPVIKQYVLVENVKILT